jgi:CheY-like chemotaxis protein
MDKVLIVESDQEVLTKIRKGFKDLHHFEMLTAADGETALSILNRSKIAVFVTAIPVPGIEGTDLIAFMTRKKPDTPCIVLVEPNTPKPWFQDRTGHENVLYYLQKPFQFGNLASAIFVAQNLKDEGLSRKGITLRNFLPLIEISRKTCRLDITSGGQKRGSLYFDRGILLDAHCESLTGEQAAREMTSWNRVSLTLSELPKDRTRKIIKTELMEIARALWGKPGSHGGRPPSAAAAGRQSAAKGETRLQAALNRYVNMLQTVKGYKGMAVLSPDGNVLASDSRDASIDFPSFVGAFNQLLSNCQQTTYQRGFQKCTGLTVHTTKGLILLMASDVMKEGNFRFLVLMDPNGNSYFMQVQLAKIIPTILSAR